MLDLLVATRNLTRNRRRASTALLTVAVGLVAMVLADGFIQWVFWAMREGEIQAHLGHVQAVRPGYHAEGIASPFDYMLPEDGPARAELAAMPGVKLMTPRVRLSGLVSRGDTTVSFLGDAVDAAVEQELRKHPRYAVLLSAGEYLSAASDAEPEVLLGRGLARSLGAGVGESVILLANTASGGINAVEARVKGIFVTASEAYDEIALRIPLGLGQTLLRTNDVHMWLFYLDETARTDEFLARFRARAGQEGGGLEFVPWHERADFYNKTTALYSRQMQVVQLIIAIIIVLSISNMLVMNVLERTGEIGTLMAVGFRRRRILRLFLAEGVLIGLVGGAAGVAIGYALAQIISAVGIPMPPPPGMDQGYTAEIRVTWNSLLNAFFTALATTTVAGLYPAWKASRLPIVDALRHRV